eukprot:c53040_g1_i1.p1 GENE.c53040_g1_i1~~c53040_g1_i1.p1  ORF type:complete len:543 (-),score=130.16 c53040_g1_i1:105-1733(-)
MAEARLIAKCKWFDRKKGYGFLEVSGQEDVFVHQSEIQVDGFRALYPEQEVEFTLHKSSDSDRQFAIKVSGVNGESLKLDRRPAAGRGRGRSRGRGRGRGGRGARGGRGGAAQAPSTEQPTKTEAKPKNPAKKPKRGKLQFNVAFVFVKPHALTDAVKQLVRDKLAEHSIRVLSEGSLTSEEIDKKQLIDKHYYSIASKATILKPNQLAVPAETFNDFFKADWQKELQAGTVFNAADACTHLNVDANKMDELWAAAKTAKKLVKFGGGFYCAKIEHGGKSIYVFNGFFMEMRSKYTQKNSGIHYFVVKFARADLSWTDFRAKVLGPTDPTEGPTDSLRGTIFAKWKELGLSSVPNVGDNGVHASASPFESLSERVNWLGANVDSDPLGKALLKAGLTEDALADWFKDPQVEVPLKGGDKAKKSLFDALEDLDTKPTFLTLLRIAGVPVPPPFRKPLARRTPGEGAPAKSEGAAPAAAKSEAAAAPAPAAPAKAEGASKDKKDKKEGGRSQVVPDHKEPAKDKKDAPKEKSAKQTTPKKETGK